MASIRLVLYDTQTYIVYEVMVILRSYEQLKSLKERGGLVIER